MIASATIENRTIVQRYVDAYNRQDIGSMSKLMASEIEWFSVKGSTLLPMAAGKEHLLKILTEQFSDQFDPASKLSGWSVNGAVVAVKETVSWETAKGKIKSQSSTAVYEVQNAKIRRVWYFDASSE
ncbi:MAG: nuclear transport factor 2 family protein [Parasphingorhabdus sp.]